MELGIRLHFSDGPVYVPVSSMTPCWENGENVYRTQVRHVQVLWRPVQKAYGTEISMEVTSHEPLMLTRIDSLVFSVAAPEKTDRVVFLGRDRYVNEIRFPWELAQDTEYSIICAGLAPALDEKGFFLAGISPFTNVYGSVALKHPDGTFTFCAKTEYTRDMLQETTLRTERVFFCWEVTVNEYLQNYRTLLPQSQFPMPKLTGWNTWDYYTSTVRPEDIAENVEALKKLPFAKELRYVVVDDGWQKAWGDWTENEKFACGIKAVADNIRQAGFLPGIWMAPLRVKEDAALLTTHPEWFCRNTDGTLFDANNWYYLDPTNPEVETFIMDNYRYQYACGYRLFKIDYVSAMLKIKVFYDKTATPYGVLKRLMAKIQEATGPDAVLLGCSLPLECGADIAPSMRIAVDIHNHFPHVVWIAQSLAWSWMYNNKVSRIDPDFLVVRGEETSNEGVIWYKGERNDFVAPPRHLQTDADRQRNHWRHGDQFNAVEAETWANLVAVAGGNLFLSDRMSVLNEKGISIIENALAISGDEVVPLYQKDDRRLPSVWLGDKAVLLINWEDVPRKLSFAGIKGPITSNKPFTLEGDTLTVTLLPHESFAGKF